MTRLELKQIRQCPRCRRGVAELETPDGARLRVVLEGVRVRALAGEADDLRWVDEVLLDSLRALAAPPVAVVLDAVAEGVRGLVTLGGRAQGEVIACAGPEAIGLAIRGRLPLYATEEALARGAGHDSDTHDPGRTVH